MSCPLCSVDERRIAFSTELVIAIWDELSASPGRLLVFPRRHVQSWSDLSSTERAATWSAIDQGQVAISERFHPDGFNVGFDQGAAAGQTIFHFHLHIVPRYEGDVVDLRGRVPYAIPANATHLPPGVALPELDIKRLVTGGDDPLLPHLRLHLDKSTASDIAVAFLTAALV
jgi:diadenosine tetraphosphate (Ap4A) HIT family hydrolase